MRSKKPHSPSDEYEGNTFSTSAQRAFHGGTRRRMVWAGAAALVGLAALILFGPSQEEVKKRFEYYGAPGDLQIMPEIAIEDGSDQIRQIPKTLMTPPPPAHIEIEPEETSEDATEPQPRDALNEEEPPVEWPTTEATPTTELVETNQVELSLPRQSSPDWYILHQVLPEYPFDAPEQEQRIPVVLVKVAIFVDKEGLVTEAIIQSAGASGIFTNEVLEKVKQWKFGWRVDPRAGRWIELTFNFNSPYRVTPSGDG